MKTFSKILLALYLLTLLWLVLFKFSFDFSSVLLEYQSRSLNLIPFLGIFEGNSREMIDNFVVFVPFGLLLGVNFKQVNMWRKLAIICAVSVAFEILQYVLAIGTTDITDVITNTLGGFIGLLLYDLGKKYIDDQKLNRFIVVTGAVLLILLLLFRFFVIRVRY
jgi:glycopeptide antibiotics resistance protein